MAYELPPLPYAYNALEPHMDEATVKLHHDMHHKGYVDGLNKAEEMLAKARETGDFAMVKHWSREMAFHGSGHFMHTMYWENMAPNAGGPATGKIAAQIEKDFGSYDSFKKQYSAAAVAVEGSGWAVLCREPRAKRLEILQSEKHQDLTLWGVTPLLVVDVWEHAYYLKFQNKRAAFVETWWNLVNWNDVNARFATCA
ncbi:MAG: superoxide dismutase [bacterium]|nr:superoxide dismutase [bacterium]